ncbi:MAG: serine/threonine protein kinase [Anaerolineae bacterium]|nr:serine/threonine protein kinase [Anaerolineae bacterium]
MALPKGTKLKRDRYQIQRLLARGGFGFLYLALDQLTGRQIVLKELIPALVSDADALRRFVREGRTLQRLDHPNVIRAEAMFKEQGHHYLVLEYLSGGTLSDELRRGRKFELGDAVMIISALCDAVTYLHQKGITHCDLQPGNILFDDQGQPKLIDLGIAHISDALVHRPWHTERDLAIGTVLYMAPEQLEGVRDDPRVDLYALGTLLYHMLTGHHYLDFDLKNTPGARADNVALVRDGVPTPIPDIPDKINQVLLRALAKQPQDRYSTVDAFRQELVQVTLPRLSPSNGAYVVSSFGLDNQAQLVRKPKTEEWPGWVWMTLAFANIGMMLLIAFLLFTIT